MQGHALAGGARPYRSALQRGKWSRTWDAFPRAAHSSLAALPSKRALEKGTSSDQDAFPAPPCPKKCCPPRRASIASLHRKDAGILETWPPAREAEADRDRLDGHRRGTRRGGPGSPPCPRTCPRNRGWQPPRPFAAGTWQ